MHIRNSAIFSEYDEISWEQNGGQANLTKGAVDLDQW